jgi:hypothetical protein
MLRWLSDDEVKNRVWLAWFEVKQKIFRARLCPSTPTSDHTLTSLIHIAKLKSFIQSMQSHNLSIRTLQNLSISSSIDATSSWTADVTYNAPIHFQSYESHLLSNLPFYLSSMTSPYQLFPRCMPIEN